MISVQIHTTGFEGVEGKRGANSWCYSGIRLELCAYLAMLGRYVTKLWFPGCLDLTGL